MSLPLQKLRVNGEAKCGSGDMRCDVLHNVTVFSDEREVGTKRFEQGACCFLRLYSDTEFRFHPGIIHLVFVFCKKRLKMLIKMHRL